MKKRTLFIPQTINESGGNGRALPASLASRQRLGIFIVKGIKGNYILIQL